ncbi:hypothetical protein BJN34_04720 [Cupriavidus necator]|uniref:Uncharacterized protein n=1 Tax=Cupriavidus necator TaxID=106590 RepID=A0A1U9UKV0_CUPNE|nr:hypothetical protein [Cupriavidus necator]AQV93199.1 hypothetical protein BJN34_04720 [Cupriavidus necator]
MSIWQARPLEEVPTVLLVSWRILETHNGLRHFVGVRPERGTYRVSTVIVELDVVNLNGVTHSGRKYVLDGPPGEFADEERDYVWAEWCRVNGVSHYRDVTDEVTETPQ